MDANEEGTGRGRPTARSRRPSAAQKIKNFFTGGLRGSSPQPKSREYEPAKLTKSSKPSRDASQVRYPKEPSSRSLPNDPRQKQHRRENEKRGTPVSGTNTGNMPPSSGDRGRGKILNVDSHANGPSTANDMRSSSLPPPIPPKDARQPVADAATRADHYSQRLREQRRAIAEGRLERVAPGQTEIQTPILTIQKQKELPVQKTFHKRTGSSGSGKWREYLTGGADCLDASLVGISSSLNEKTKKISAKLRSPFDSSRHYDDDSDSDESFCCIGESGPDKLESARRSYSGKGVHRAASRENDKCRLCGSKALNNVRFLCRDCEKYYPTLCEGSFRPAPLNIQKNDAPPNPGSIPRDIGGNIARKPVPEAIDTTLSFADDRISRERRGTIARKPVANSSFTDDGIPRKRRGNAARKPVVVTPKSHVAQQAIRGNDSQSRGRDMRPREPFSPQALPNYRDSFIPNPCEVAYALRSGLRSTPSPERNPTRKHKRNEPVSPVSSYGSIPRHNAAYYFDHTDLYDDSKVSPLSAEFPLQGRSNVGSRRDDDRPLVSERHQGRNRR